MFLVAHRMSSVTVYSYTNFNPFLRVKSNRAHKRNIKKQIHCDILLWLIKSGSSVFWKFSFYVYFLLICNFCKADMDKVIFVDAWNFLLVQIV